ncbi:hypothetical protein RB653_004198 [Dictyostelium firmibasis]|uniref:Uncharacterized protein n=1 Tax=Dictyostelium firmibasis TaxID=79012 RepID=A0AAN7U9C2_9MYCE
MNKNDKDLEKFKRVKAIINGDVNPFIPKSTKSSTKSSTTGGSSKKNSMFKKQLTSNKKSKKVVQQKEEEDEEEEEEKYQYGGDDEDDNGENELDTYKLPKRFDDEEIEEEDAFDDADEDLIKSKANKNYDDDFEGEDFVDLDELLDEKEETSSISSKSTKQDNDEEDEVSEDDSLFSDNEEDEPSEQEDEEEEETNSLNLMSIVKNLEKTKRSVKDQSSIKSTTKLPDMTEVIGNESQFNIFPNADENGTIDINDLMSFIPEEFDKVKSQLDEIADKAPISTPVTKYERDTIQRRITTEQAHKILTQWVPFVREQREKNLKFESRVVVSNTASTLANRFSKTELNDEISKAMMESGASVDHPAPGAVDPTTGKKIVDPIEEKRRLREIIKLRSIMYYQEVKDKRKKKIKSKKFRKIEKKKKEKDLAKREEELMKLDPEYAKHKAEKLEERRVLERMTQRHKNNSKFMKNILNNRGLTTDDRRDINEHQKLAKELLLMNKINNSNVDDEDSSDESDDDDDDDDDSDDNDNKNTKKIDLSDVDQKSLTDKERIQMKLQKLGRPTTLPDKGINAMKFMQKSMERELDDAIKQQNGIDDYEQAELDDQEREIEESNRIVFHKQVASNKLNPSNKIMSSGLLVEKAGFGNGHKVGSGSSIQIDSPSNNNNIKKQQKQQQQDNQQFEEEELDEENPWLEVKKSKKKSKKDKKKQSDEFLISLDNLNNGGVLNSNNSNKNNNVSKEVVKGNDLSNDNNATTTANKKDKKRKLENNKEQTSSEKKSKSLGMSLITSNKQKELLLEAFAKDNIEDEFMEEKKQLVEEDVPEEKSNFLPGWGSWVGDGTEQRDNSKKEAALKRKRDQKIKQMAEKRTDAKNSRVIIDEKAPLDGVSKYVLNQLPQHYSNKEQYESTLSIAHGKDWNSTTAFRKLIEPKVSVMPGTFIKPVSIKDKQDFIMKKKEESAKKSKK